LKEIAEKCTRRNGCHYTWSHPPVSIASRRPVPSNCSIRSRKKRNCLRSKYPHLLRIPLHQGIFKFQFTSTELFLNSGPDLLAPRKLVIGYVSNPASGKNREGRGSIRTTNGTVRRTDSLWRRIHHRQDVVESCGR